MRKVKLFLINLCMLFPLLGEGISHTLSQIPIKETFLMREFADQCFVWDQAGYTLFFDNKPCCLTGVWVENPAYHESLWLKGWETFKKYEHLFKHENLILSSYLCMNKTNLRLFIINKSNLKKCLNEHKTTFKSVLGKQCSYNWFVSKLEDNIPLEDVIQGNEVLLGILLGFGKESSQAFEEHNKHQSGYCLISPDVYSRIAGDISPESECHSIAFAGNPHSAEVQSLLAAYRKELKTFSEMYKNKDPLILFLEGLCQKESDVLPGIKKAKWQSKLKLPAFMHLYFLDIKYF